jgi:predicted membrane chloride channel (bestrophin family)
LSDSIDGCGAGDFAKMKMDAEVTLLTDYVGKCERIFKAPIPVFYTRHTSRFLSFWLLALPLALYSRFEPGAKILMVPSVCAITFFLLGIEELAVQIEEPFSLLPLYSMAEGIEASVFEAYNTASKRPPTKFTGATDSEGTRDSAPFV